MNYVQVVDICCSDLRRYLEYALVATRGGVVTVKMNRVMQAAPPPRDRTLYARCLGGVLRRWRWSTGVYVMPRSDAEALLKRFDESCASARNQVAAVHNSRRASQRIGNGRLADRETAMISFHAPRALVQALDEYARLKNITRSDVVRDAVKRLIEKYRDVEADPQSPPTAPPPATQEDELECITFHETLYVAELLDRYAAALQVTRSDVVRVAIRQLIDRMQAV